MNELVGNNQLTEKLAQAAHELFYEEMKRRGYVYGPVTDEKKKRHSSLLPFTELPEDEKEQNRGTVRDIPDKLSLVGYKIVPARRLQSPPAFTKEEIEKLSIKEHKRWMDQKLKVGWQYAPETDKIKKLHKWIIPYEQLPDKEKEKDRVMVMGIPKILAKAGYMMEKI